jgi:hypothetical protein
MENTISYADMTTQLRFGTTCVICEICKYFTDQAHRYSFNLRYRKSPDPFNTDENLYICKGCDADHRQKIKDTVASLNNSHVFQYMFLCDTLGRDLARSIVEQHYYMVELVVEWV